MSRAASFSGERALAFMRKEMLQVWRDPSSILIAVVMPIMLMFIFGYGVSLDSDKVTLGVALEDSAPEARSLAYAFGNTRYFEVTMGHDRHALEADMVASRLRGVVVIPQDFSRKLREGTPAQVQVLADGSETNTASFVQNYAEGVVSNWNASREGQMAASGPINPELRVWFNPELKSRNVLLPGSIAVIMAMIGTMLTALVVAREWERGTMEAVMATPIRIYEMLIGKMAPYFLLGMGSMALCVFLSVVVFDVPFRGSLPVLLLATALFLLAALSQGLLISSAARSQFVAVQLASMMAFLPTFMLSGFLFEVDSMPAILQWISYLLPPRYFVSILQATFIAGTVWSLFIPNMLAMLAIFLGLLWLTARRSVKRLD